MFRSLVFLLAQCSAIFRLASAIVLDIDDPQSIRDAAAIVAHGVQQLYNGNQSTGVPGKWPYPPYYWWESGGAWGGMMEYWHYTGDESYVNVSYNALISQLGPANDFNVPAEAFDEGNDDQAFWVFAALSAAEYSFPDPPSPYPSWLRCVQNAWELYASRWGTATCNGGLKWQFHPENAGYTYKNSISNGAFFQLSARLARFTGNETYVEWSEKTWNWTTGIGLLDNIYNVFDGTDETINCSEVDHHQWSYNVGVYLYGAAVLQNYTNGSSTWVTRTSGLLDATSTFLTPYKNATGILFEAQCEPASTCNVDQLSMKAYLARWLAGTSILAPFTAGRVGKILRTSAIGAATACTGGPFGNTCGTKWYINATDGISGLGQQLCAMEVMYALLTNETNPPKTFPNVRIQTAPTSVTSTLPQPTQTSRPLYDSGGHKLDQQSNQILQFFPRVLAIFFMVH